MLLFLALALDSLGSFVYLLFDLVLELGELLPNLFADLADFLSGFEGYVLSPPTNFNCAVAPTLERQHFWLADSRALPPA